MLTALALFAYSHAGEFHDLNSAKIARGDLAELNKAFEVLSKSNGAKAEELDIDIGKSIIANPKNFLRAYLRNKPLVTRLDALVGNLGPGFVDDFSNQSAELRRRIKALEAVKDRKLKPLAEECIAQLRKNLSSLEN